jgi:hypothetical protein
MDTSLILTPLISLQTLYRSYILAPANQHVNVLERPEQWIFWIAQNRHFLYFDTIQIKTL